MVKLAVVFTLAIVVLALAQTTTRSSTGTVAYSSVPAGMILMTVSRTCPSGYSEAVELDGVILVGTLSSHNNVGTIGGSIISAPKGGQINFTRVIFCKKL
jgi:hypothetical protein